MADTKIRTDRLNVASLVKSILDATTTSAIQTLLDLVPGVNVQAYDANLLTTSNAKTVTNKTINPPSTGQICSSAGVVYSISSAYDQVQNNVTAAISGFKMSSSAPRYSNQIVRAIFSPSGGDWAITWDASIVAATGVTLPTTLYNGKITVIQLVPLRFSSPNYYWMAISVAVEA